MMDAQARKKALYRAKLKDAAQKREKRLDSPLVRYNESDQLVCRVCDVILKSESLWPAHQASRKHHEAIQNFKATAAGLSGNNNIKREVPNNLPQNKPDRPTELHKPKPAPPTEFQKPRSSSMLPEDFFDSQAVKRQRIGTGGEIESSVPHDFVKLVDSDSSSPVSVNRKSSDLEKQRGVSFNVDAMEMKSINESKPATELQTSGRTVGKEVKQVKGALPEGFFDNKDADLRARGIEPVKPNIKDEYKEFEKVIKEDLQEVDDRLEEEEFDAAETREDAESVEQKAYRERVEMLKMKQMELRAARSSGQKAHGVTVQDLSDEESSEDEDDEEENFAVDWRAKHI